MEILMSIIDIITGLFLLTFLVFCITMIGAFIIGIIQILTERK